MLEQNLETKTSSLFQKFYIKKVLKYTNMLESKPIYSSIISKINFCKNKNESLDKNFIHLYQFYINTHI